MPLLQGFLTDRTVFLPHIHAKRSETEQSEVNEPRSARLFLFAHIPLVCGKAPVRPAGNPSGLLEESPMIELVGEADSFAQTIQMTNDLKPQVVLMDVHMKDQATYPVQDIKTQLNVRIVAISLANDRETRALAESFGAVALLDKSELADELIPTIQKLA
jgi:CheY-like chemotaxis protein